jgi:CarboxypepD_reg-like domain
MIRRRIAVTLALAAFARTSAAQTIRGTIVDSASGKGVARARVGVGGTTLQATTDSLGKFTIAAAPSGDQVLSIHTPSLDSLNAGYSAPVTVGPGTTNIAVRVPSALQIAGTACGERGFGNGGIVLGRLRVADDSTAPLAGTVSAEWKAASKTDSSRWVSATADARGRFALCGVPLDTALSLRAVTDGASGQAADVRISSAARFGRAEVVLHRAVTTTATFAGVVTDSAGKPIPAVEITAPDLGKGTTTNEQGAFVLRDIPGGSQRVLARHVGYGPVESQLAFVGGQTIQRHITMARSTTLDSVVVTGKSVDHALDDFEVNRKLGLGHFLTRAELAKQEGRSTGDVLSSFPGIRVFTIGPYAWVGSGRKAATSLMAHFGLDPSDSTKQAPLWDCYALIYIDDHLVWRGQKFTAQSRRGAAGGAPTLQWEPLFDINSIPVATIEAIEYYASAAQAPMKYAVLNSQCGIVVIHTLRYHSTDTTATAAKPPKG